VDLLSNFSDKIEFKAGVRSKDGKAFTCLEMGDALFKNSYDNV
jgi:hypothetical protein